MKLAGLIYKSQRGVVGGGGQCFRNTSQNLQASQHCELEDKWATYASHAVQSGATVEFVNTITPSVQHIMEPYYVPFIHPA